MKILKKIWNFFELLGQAKAAGILARQGLHQEAIDRITQTQLTGSKII